MMRIRTRPLFYPVLALGILQPLWTVEVPAARERHAAPASNWEEDFRRCLIRKTLDAGSITISFSDSSLEVYVLWSDETRLDDLKGTKIRAEIDQDQFELRPMKSDPGTASTYLLGPFATIAPLWSKGRWLILAFSDHPDRNLRVPIGNGTKAIGFLKECEAYWENGASGTHNWHALPQPGKAARAVTSASGALPGPWEMSDFSPQSAPKRTLIQVAVTFRDFCEYTG